MPFSERRKGSLRPEEPKPEPRILTEITLILRFQHPAGVRSNTVSMDHCNFDEEGGSQSRSLMGDIGAVLLAIQRAE